METVRVRAYNPIRSLFGWCFLLAMLVAMAYKILLQLGLPDPWNFLVGVVPAVAVWLRIKRAWSRSWENSSQ